MRYKAEKINDYWRIWDKKKARWWGGKDINLTSYPERLLYYLYHHDEGERDPRKLMYMVQDYRKKGV